jgi:N-methylhydantoinase A
MLVADVVKDYAKTLLLAASTVPLEELQALVAQLTEQGLREMKDEGVAEESVVTEASLDMRYVGQSYELAVPWDRDVVARFHDLHRKSYGYANPAREAEIVTIRLRVRGGVAQVPLARVEAGPADPTAARVGERRIFIGDTWVGAPVYAREALRAGNRIAGPALVAEMSATTFVAPEWEGRVDTQGNLLLHRRESP